MAARATDNLHDHLLPLHLDSPFSASSTSATVESYTSETARVAAHDGIVVSPSLPADDGMHHLRARIHDIRKMTIPEEEKARMVHNIMTERYNLLRPQSPSSFISNDRPFTPVSGQSVFSDIHLSSPASAPSEFDPENPFNVQPGDQTPSYRLRSSEQNLEHGGEDEDFDTAEDGSSLGCQHYKRNVKVQCYDCRRWYTCRHCHDAVEDHNLRRRKTENMLCMGCGTAQKAGSHCSRCNMQTAWYYCNICKLWDDNSSKKIYHCEDCGICRKGEGLGKDYIHCKRCNVCISISHAENHRCLERATDCNCPICGDYLFDSSSAVVSLPCGHYLHKGCYKSYMETAYQCPMCKKSAVNMELQWRKLTQAIEAQPMPEQFASMRAVIQCNDCSAKSAVAFHWLGNKCSTCDSYNTNELRILNGPESEQQADAIVSAEGEVGSRSPASVASPASQPLHSPRYYFQPDQPEETWLPGQLPSFPFQMPQFRGMPQMQMPQFPGMPQLPHLPQMPQMPDPSELMERVSRSFAYYLNPTEEVPEESVPIIDLDDDELPEFHATDGSTVRPPSLPQYVLERFSRSFTPLRNYLNPTMEPIPQLDLSESRDPEGLQFWGEDGQRVQSVLAGEEEESEEESDSSADEEEEDDDDEGEDRVSGKEFDLPWKP
ncbi:CHY zinc finger domain-containing protein [Sporormia fimetaria CBS 119925]|uniref:CHY zinc finger domain-containing protein n=1 Tax=Sporormia fimetaria CBS 119925 TaxID=1340428 RepID=A0A6A6V7G2_9PLEO|nr:CHY zinc finger domain-containing protein [Sporormia fimetaria CBS 119925]